MAVIGLIFVGLAFLSAAMLLPASAAISSETAPCHQDSSMPLPIGHHPSNHDCCTVGHDRALPSHSMCALPVVSIEQIRPDLSVSDSQGHVLPEFNDSGPPGLAPLRI